MIIRPNKAYECNSAFPNSNPYPEEINNIIIDETTEEGKFIAEKIFKTYPHYDLVIQEGNVVDITEWPPVEYQISSKRITTLEICTITFSLANVTAIVDGNEILIEDGSLEYSNENVGLHTIVLKAPNYRDTIIQVEVI